jgi:hypothetical protein
MSTLSVDILGQIAVFEYLDIVHFWWLVDAPPSFPAFPAPLEVMSPATLDEFNAHGPRHGRTGLSLIRAVLTR